MEDLGYPNDEVDLVGGIYANTTTSFHESYFKNNFGYILVGALFKDIIKFVSIHDFFKPLLRQLEVGSLGYPI